MEPELRAEVEKLRAMMVNTVTQLRYLRGVMNAMVRMLPVVIAERHMSEAEAAAEIEERIGKETEEAIQESDAILRKIL